jgi:hypothetical protein
VYFDRISDSTFSIVEAESIIDTLIDQGNTRNANICKSYLEKARGFWEDCDYTSTNEYLQRVRGSVPEAGLLTTFGLMALFIRMRNRVRS